MVAVSLFGNISPENFEVFDKAFVTLFHVTSGDPWPETLPSFNEDGTVNWLVTGFVFAYTMIVIWVILQVSSALGHTACRRKDFSLIDIVLKNYFRSIQALVCNVWSNTPNTQLPPCIVCG